MFLGGMDAIMEPRDEVADDPAQDGAPVTMKAIKCAYDDGRNTSRGSLDFVTKVWSNTYKMRIAQAMVSLGEPYYDDFGTTEAADSTQWGVLSNNVRLAMGFSFQIAIDTLRILQSDELRHKLQLLSTDAHPDTLSDAEKIEDDLIAHRPFQHG